MLKRVKRALPVLALALLSASTNLTAHAQSKGDQALLDALVRKGEVLQLFNFAEKSPAFAILLKSSPLILRHLNKAVFGKTGNFQQNQIFATLPVRAPKLPSQSRRSAPRRGVAGGFLPLACWSASQTR